eukprot:CAMPEP_0118946420 /NCGR_PEP_ID=MMETSP1169-20130426/44183_1 /TAXON_ID=36882 /ORGANISM="Pyramimonas obovata, Strain CCMP722" /LENGTH=63 /DNA_ID=CAMNT_0006892385 /DNA_START=96 /DNA_END=284 /DNA_ORIENTATION=+
MVSTVISNRSSFATRVAHRRTGAPGRSRKSDRSGSLTDPPSRLRKRAHMGRSAVSAATRLVSS